MTVNLKIFLALALLSSAQLPAYASSSAGWDLAAYRTASSKAKSAKAALDSQQIEIRSRTACTYQGGPKIGQWGCR